MWVIIKGRFARFRPIPLRGWFPELAHTLPWGVGCWDQALSIKPDLYEAWTNRALALSNLGRYEEAVACYDRAADDNN
ncbi:MAG: tetratricopeptide repeat protein [Hormoscilla sp. GM7CHS1pb]|nr:tetratricopeptide repeat protein [Hormoscilla sp. GM7CHS1pb]